MNGERDPLRLLDPRSEAPGGVRRALSAGRAEAPPRDALARMAAKLPVGGTGGGQNTPSRGAGARGLPGAATPSVLPGVLAGALLGALVSGGLAVWTPGDGDGDGAAGAGAAVVAVSESASLGGEGEARTGTATVTVTGTVTATATATATATVASSAEYGSERGVSPGNGAPKGKGAASVEAAARGGAPAESVGGGPGTPVIEESESALVRRAQEALGPNPGLALALANQHLARHPGGMFAQEREVIAISALRALGRSAEAESRAAAFLSAHPGSAYRPRVEAPASQGDRGK